LNPQLLDDFFGEADEHLLAIRQGLVGLEGSIDKAEPDLNIIKDLFQQFHSLKGISAIVGLHSAQALAHATEDFLRLMRDGKAQLSAQGLEAMTAATQRLGQVIAAFRAQKPLPDCQTLLEELKQQYESWAGAESLGTAAGFAAQEAIETAIEEAKASSLLLWHFTFTPTLALDARGLNVSSIREELGKIGKVLNLRSEVREGGQLVFEFLVATAQAPLDLPSWEAKGVALEPADEETWVPVTSQDRSHQGAEVEHSPFLAPSHIVRVDLKQLDELMRITGEMVIHRSRLDTQMTHLNRAARGLDLTGVTDASGGLSRSLRDLREAIMRVRLVPVAEIFARMPFVVRDLARQTDKRVRLELKGQQTAIDKYLIERLKDPLLHLVRNAFSHGVETVSERVSAGKPAEATIELSASTIGDSAIIAVRDDGRGIDPRAIAQRARQLGIPFEEPLSGHALLELLCASGFSIRADADLASGRGVGMGVVQSAVRDLGGNLTLSSEEGRGTTFTIQLPLTLAIADTLIVRSAGQTCALPQGFLREVLLITESDIRSVNGVEAIPYRDGVLPLRRLTDLFRLKPEPGAKCYVLVIESVRGSMGLITEEIIGEREVVVRALRDPLIQVPGISGATELGDGKPVLILDGAALTNGAVRPVRPEMPDAPKQLEAEALL
jgi:two-component system chemotaxis sensor kinase CheA